VERPDLLVISSFRRSRETAEPTINALGDEPTVEEWPVHEFTYVASWRNEYTTVEKRKLIVDLFWDIADPIRSDGPGAESFQEFI
jgi:broad specificity phosphatase PhoE